MVSPDTPSIQPATTYLMLKGHGPLAAGQSIRIALGESVVCGRSRHCDWSLKRSPAYLKTQGASREALQGKLVYASVSRKHARITFHAADRVEIENLSTNSTYVDGTAVDCRVLTDCLQREHKIRLGAEGPLLELHPGSLPL